MNVSIRSQKIKALFLGVQNNCLVLRFKETANAVTQSSTATKTGISLQGFTLIAEYYEG
jgi:hypothetical protein